MSPIGRPVGVTADQTRAAVLAAAAAEFSERGYTRSSIRRIADRAGVTSAAIYYHFATKLACLEAVQGNALEIMRSRWEPVMARDEPVGDRIAHLLEASAVINREYPHMARISAYTLIEDVTGHPEMTKVMKPARAYLESVFDRLVADAVGRGEIPGSCTQAVRDMISGLLYGLAYTAALEQPPDRYAAAMHALGELLAGRLFTRADQDTIVGGAAEL